MRQAREYGAVLSESSLIVLRHLLTIVAALLALSVLGLGLGARRVREWRLAQRIRADRALPPDSSEKRVTIHVH